MSKERGYSGRYPYVRQDEQDVWIFLPDERLWCVGVIALFVTIQGKEYLGLASWSDHFLTPFDSYSRQCTFDIGVCRRVKGRPDLFREDSLVYVVRECQVDPTWQWEIPLGRNEADVVRTFRFLTYEDVVVVSEKEYLRKGEYDGDCGTGCPVPS